MSATPQRSQRSDRQPTMWPDGVAPVAPVRRTVAPLSSPATVNCLLNFSAKAQKSPVQRHACQLQIHDTVQTASRPDEVLQRASEAVKRSSKQHKL